MKIEDVYHVGMYLEKLPIILWMKKKFAFWMHQHSSDIMEFAGSGNIRDHLAYWIRTGFPGPFIFMIYGS